MNTELSPNTQAILLLAAPLITPGRSRKSDWLSAGEYRKLAVRLRSLDAQPADLLEPGADALIEECGATIDSARLRSLLGRGFLLAQALQQWQARAIWVISRADAAYPRKLKERLRSNAPSLLYGCGPSELLHAPGFAIVGSRNVDEPLLDYTRNVATLAAGANRILVSGAARGVDRAAMNGALDAGGKATGVLAGGLQRAVMNREHRNLLLEERLVLISPFDPAAGFQVGNAMQRNKSIYALADAGLVVNAVRNKGGTWAGALEQLRKYPVPVYVRSTGIPSDGLDALRAEGARPWPNPTNPDELEEVLEAPPCTRPAAGEQGELFHDEATQSITAQERGRQSEPTAPTLDLPKRAVRHVAR